MGRAERLAIETALSKLSSRHLDYATMAITSWFGFDYPSNFENTELSKRDWVRQFCNHLFNKIAKDREFCDNSEAIAKLRKMLSIDAPVVINHTK